MQIGGKHRAGRNAHDRNDPTLLQDVFFRIGGAEPGKATTSLVVNADNAILDDIWAWRADHGAGVGWTSNTADTGVIVNGDNVTAYGLFVEHFQKSEVIWNGQNGEDVFFQNEMPYDPPSQAAWMSSPTTKGYPAFLVSPNVTSFQGYGMGSYSFFNQGVPIFATQAFQSPTRPGVQFHDLLTVFLDATHGSGGILSVINGVGGSSTAANADVPVDVTSYPWIRAGARRLRAPGTRQVACQGLTPNVARNARSSGWSRRYAVWDTQDHLDAFGARLMPILADVDIDPGQPEQVEVHNISTQ